MKHISTARRAWIAAIAPLTLAVAALLPTAPVFAQPHDERHWHGDIAHFHEHDWALWRGGHWVHGWHDGRLGWWWLAGGAWYFYPAPVYPYPNPYEPPVTVALVPGAPVSAAPPAPVPRTWYYCDAAKGYYPYVATCPGGWQQVPANPALPPQ